MAFPSNINPLKPDEIAEWDETSLPNFKPLSVFVLPGAFYAATVGFMAEAGFSRAESIEKADLVVFIGGSDVDPRLYGDKVLPRTHYDPDRDKIETEAYRLCRKHEIPMFGICRGAQFLHVMNGGKLWQDVDGHGVSHRIIDLFEGVGLEVTSMHHQMIKPGNRDLNILGIVAEPISHTFVSSDERIDFGSGVPAFEELEIEAGYYETTKCFFVQGHPEVGSNEFRSWTMHKLHDFLNEWLPVDAWDDDIVVIDNKPPMEVIG